MDRVSESGETALIGGKLVLAIIPARGGSKGLPRKNILPIAGKPLIAWSIEAAKKSQYIDRCIISTDSKEIAETAIKYGGDVPFMRPNELATDEAKSDDVIKHAIESLSENYEIVILLQPTSPLRTTEDIDCALEYMRIKKATALVSIVKSEKPPEWTIRIDEDFKILDSVEELKMGKRRQDYPDSYNLNGAIYISDSPQYLSTNSFFGKQTVAFIMSKEHSVDIDNSVDLQLADILLEKESN